MDEALKENFKKTRRKIFLSPMAIIAFSFLSVILIGSILLSLPYATKEGTNLTYFDHLFTSTSATCVTGLFTVEGCLADTYTLFGIIVIGILIQLGGLGVTSLAVFFFIFAKNKLSYGTQNLIKEGFNLRGNNKLKAVFGKIILISFSSELIGAILFFFSFYFMHDYSLNEAIGYSVFHSISSFNNAGIDITTSTNLISYSNDYYFLFVTALLFTLGGIGYFVIIDTVNKKFNFKKFSLHTKIVLTYTVTLIISGSLLLYLAELGNSISDTNYLNALFISASSSTTGFTTANLANLREASIILLCVFMFIGASPGGTGGGIKTTTFAIFLAYFRGVITNKSPRLFKRRINDQLIRKALLIIIVSLCLFLISLFMISAFEGESNYIKDGVKYVEYVEGSTRFSFVDYVLEAMSAFTTTGFSSGMTPYYSIGSKIILLILMYVGRIGPLTLSTMFQSKGNEKYYYVEEDVSIG